MEVSCRRKEWWTYIVGRRESRGWEYRELDGKRTERDENDRKDEQKKVKGQFGEYLTKDCVSKLLFILIVIFFS